MSPAPNTRIKGSLLTLGAAAVLTVYSAGFARTNEAAQRFERQDATRRPPARSTRPSAPVLDSVVPITHPPAPTVARSAPPVSSRRKDSVAAPKSSPAVTQPAPASPVTPPNPTTPVTQPPPDSAVKPDSARVRLKDGVYSGWGTSRHGDIEAEIEIKDGKITVAWIKQCLTQYSCSWISALPLQVIDRQSADVD